MTKITAAILIIAISLSGCASMINGTTQNISMSATERDAKLYANGDPGNALR